MILDEAYENAAHIPDGETYPQQWQQDAAAFRARLAVAGKARLGLMYEHGTRNAFDLFLPENAPGGLMVFVHGGYWLKFDRSYWSHFAQGALDRGMAVAIPSYDLCPRVRISDITRQIATAVTVAAREVDGPIWLTGHSAGGHLVARISEQGMLPSDVANRLQHVVPISPVADLRPLMQTSMNADLRIDDAEAQAESPVLHPVPAIPVTVWVGADERPAFVEQAQALAKAWQVTCVQEPGLHHFNIIDGLRHPDSPLLEALFRAG